MALLFQVSLFWRLVECICDKDHVQIGHQNGVLKAKCQLHGGCMGQDAVIPLSDKKSSRLPRRSIREVIWQEILGLLSITSVLSSSSQ